VASASNRATGEDTRLKDRFVMVGTQYGGFHRMGNGSPHGSTPEDY